MENSIYSLTRVVPIVNADESHLSVQKIKV